MLSAVPGGASAAVQPSDEKTLVVRLATDEDDADRDDGICSSVDPPNPGTCTLPAAIQTAHRRRPRHDRISLASPARLTIVLARYLPDLHHPIAIDGWTQAAIPPPRSHSPTAHPCRWQRPREAVVRNGN